MIVMGVNDYDYIIQMAVDDDSGLVQKKPPVFLSKSVPLTYSQSIIKIQAVIRGCLARRRIPLIQQKYRKILKRFLLISPEKEYVTVYKGLDARNGRKYVYARHESQKRKTNDVDIVPVVFRHLGDMKQDTFFDIFNIDFSGPSLAYSEEAEYWI